MVTADPTRQNRAMWVETVFGPLRSKLKNGLKIIPIEVDVSSAIMLRIYEDTDGIGRWWVGRPMWNTVGKRRSLMAGLTTITISG